MSVPKFECLHGRIRFRLDGCDDLKNYSIDKACQIHGVPSDIASIQNSDPFQRVLEIGEALRVRGLGTALNGKSIIGRAIKGGRKSEFWQKTMPILFEVVCFHRWPQLEPSPELGYDAFCLAPQPYHRVRIDFKCKHRNRDPHSDGTGKADVLQGQNGKDGYIATVPASQRSQPVDYYCFGQMEEEMNVGWINGVLSKQEFTTRHFVKKEGMRDGNGEAYVEDVDAISIWNLSMWHHPFRCADGSWISDSSDMFFPPEYRHLWMRELAPPEKI